MSIRDSGDREVVSRDTLGQSADFAADIDSSDISRAFGLDVTMASMLPKLIDSTPDAVRCDLVVIDYCDIDSTVENSAYSVTAPKASLDALYCPMLP